MQKILLASYIWLISSHAENSLHAVHLAAKLPRRKFTQRSTYYTRCPTPSYPPSLSHCCWLSCSHVGTGAQARTTEGGQQGQQRRKQRRGS